MIKKIITLLMLSVFATASFAETIEVKVNGLVCAFCAQGIEKTLRAKPETDAVLVSLDAGLVALTLKAGTELSDDVLRTALTESGYSVTGITRTNRSLTQIEKDLAARPSE